MIHLSFKSWIASLKWLRLIAFGFWLPATLLPAQEALKAQFANPPSPYRMLKIIHHWPDQPAAQDQQLQRLQSLGFGGMVCNVPFDGGYVESETKWNAFLRVVREAKQTGLAMWLYDEKGYPSGNAGGLVLRNHPEWEAYGLLIADAETAGTNVVLNVPPGQLKLAAAFPVSRNQITLSGRVDLAGQITNGKLGWQPAGGHWRVMVITENPLYEGTHAAHNLADHIPYPNLLLREPTARFLEVTHQQYANRLDQDLGKYFMATFTDEPSLMSLYLSPMPYRVLPWAQILPAEFRKRRGYALDKYLPALVAEAGPEGRRARHDFWLTIGELVAENFFGQIQSWCAKHRIASGGHLLFEESPVLQVASYGDFFRCIRRLDAPSIDCLTSLPPEAPWHVARLLASAGELNGKTLVMCETSDHVQYYRPPGDQRPRRLVTEDEIRGTVNRLMAGGVNCFTSYYSFKDLTDEQLRRLNEWIGRCCSLLRSGCQAADLALVYPTESLWVRFNPSRHYTKDAPAAQQVASAYLATAEALFAHARDFTIVDATALRVAKPKAGALVHEPLQWRVIILPQVDTLPLAAWKNLAAFVKQGGVVVALGTLPANSESEFPSPAVQKLAQEMFGAQPTELRVQASAAGGAGIFLPEGTESLLPGLLNKVIEADVKIAASKSPLQVTHRLSGRHIYFVINDGAEPWSGTIGLRAQGGGELWHPGNGVVESLADLQNINLQLGAYDAILINTDGVVPIRRLNLRTGLLPGLAMASLPAIEPALAGGEFVRKEIVVDSPAGQKNSPAWRAVGTLTKSGVDTYLFVRLPYANGLNLAGTEFVVLDTWVPENQRTPAELLVILHEKGGADYFAGAGRSLSGSGFSRTFVPINRFKLAGWSKDANRRLDLNDLTEIRVGWGGYFGEKDERVEFTLALPQTVKEGAW